MIRVEILAALIGASVAALGMAYTYWRGRVAGREAQHVRYERFYERLLEQPAEDIEAFLRPTSTAPTPRQEVLLLWYFTVAESAYHMMRHSVVDRVHARGFLESLSAKFGCVPGMNRLLRAEGFDADFIEILAFRDTVD